MTNSYVYTVSSADELAQAITKINQRSQATGQGSNLFTVTLNKDINLRDLTASAELPAINLDTIFGDVLDIQGNGHILDGRPTVTHDSEGGTASKDGARGLSVYAGNVLIDNLQIQNATARGSDGSAGRGGRAGLGGGLFVGSQSHVALSNVVFGHDSAVGGNGGAVGVKSEVTNNASIVTGELCDFGNGGDANHDAGFGGGAGDTNRTGGGLGAGGDIFVQAGGSLAIDGGALGYVMGPATGLLSDAPGSVRGGVGSDGLDASTGRAYGAGIFLQGDGGDTPTLKLTSNGLASYGDAITDQHGSDSTSCGSVGVEINDADHDGIVNLKAVNTYTGKTIVHAGTLLIDGSIASSPVEVEGGATLGGYGRTGTVMVEAGGTLSAGSDDSNEDAAKPVSFRQITVGGLEMNGAPTASPKREALKVAEPVGVPAPGTTPAATFVEKIGGTAAGRDGGASFVNYDQTVVTGGSVQLNGAMLKLDLVDGTVPAPGSTFTIIDNQSDGAVDGIFTDEAGNPLVEGASVTAEGTTFTISYKGGDVTLTTVAAPSAGGSSGPAIGTPIANDATSTTAQDTPDPILLTGTDPDTPALPLTYAIATGPTHGVLTGLDARTGALTYVPDAGYSGADSFTFTDSNGSNTSKPATVGITVTPAPLAPAAAQALNTPTNNSVAVPAPSLVFDPTVSVEGPDRVGLTGTASAPSGIVGVELFEGDTDLGPATLDPATGAWSFTYSNGPGFHTGLTAVATAKDGSSTSAWSGYDLTTGVRGEPYRVVQDSYDPETGTFFGQTFFKAHGAVYVTTAYTGNADSTITTFYSSGRFFDDKSYYAYAETSDQAGNLLQDTYYNNDGTQDIHGYTPDQLLRTAGSEADGYGADTFYPTGGGNTFSFSRGAGHDTITSFVLGGRDHDTISLPAASRGKLDAILAGATDRDGAVTLHLNPHDAITIEGVTAAQLQAHRRDIAFHA